MLTNWIAATVLLQFCILNGVSGDFTVALAIFSGVQDPEWLVTSTDPNYIEIRTRLIAAIQNDWAYLPEDLPPVLGYKGILVTPNMKKKKSVVQGVTGERLIVGPITVQLQMLLFNTMPKNESFPPENLCKQISKIIASGAVKPQKAQKRTKRYAPPFVTAPWVTRNRQLNNNCYNYATTIPTGHFSQPGIASGTMAYPPINGVNVLNSAVGDGLAVLNVVPGGPVPVNPPLPNQDHVVALVVWPGVDFHWYRLDDTGTWSHKPGKTRITQQDNAGNPIIDPRNAAMAGYQFVSFMICNRNAVNIN